MKNFKQNLKGYGLVELVLAIGIFATISAMLVLLVVDSTRTFENIQARSKATQLTQRIYSTLVLLKYDAWYNIARHTDEGLKHLEYINGEYTILDGEIEENGLVYSFSIGGVNRDNEGNLIEGEGIYDPHSRVINIYIRWTDRLGKINDINPKIYVNDWNTHSLVYTTQEDWDLGQYTETMSENILGGEVRLLSLKYADWCNPLLSLTAHDLTRSGVASALFTIGDHVYMGTGGNMSGPAFAKISVTGEPPLVEELGTYDGHKVYDVWGLNGFALLATDTNAKELVIIDISSPENIYTEFTYLDVPNPGTKQKFLYVNQDKGYLTHDNKITIFRIDSLQKDIPPTIIQTVTVGNSGVITDLYVDDNYIYVATQGGVSDFYIFSNQSPYSLLGQIDLGTMNISSLFISEDKNRAYLGALNNPGHELFIVDISNKNNTYQIISSRDLGGLSVSALVSADNRIMIGGISSEEEYIVYDITNEISPFKCGGIKINSGINMVTLVKKDPNLYTYVLTRDSSKELQIIKGGPGGGGPDGEGYVKEGMYLSKIFDSESITSEYYVLALTTTVPEGTSLEIQFRVSNNPDMSDSTWIGPDGTSNTYFENTGVYNLPPFLIGRYIQHRAIFKSDTVETPLLEEIIINYEK